MVPVRCVFQHAPAALLAAIVATAAGGCWLAALQLAPVGVRAAEGIGAGVLSLGGGTTIPSAGVVELHTAPSGAPEYRELRIDDSLAEPRWTPVVGKDTTPAGWRPAVNFPHMSFAPPLSFPKTGASYLAYLPVAGSESPSDDDQLAAFTSYFGKPVGTFTWQGRVYQYSLPRALPRISRAS
jgi:hypothetical protein